MDPVLLGLVAYAAAAAIAGLCFSFRIPQVATHQNPAAARVALAILAPLWMPGLVVYYATLLVTRGRGKKP